MPTAPPLLLHAVCSLLFAKGSLSLLTVLCCQVANVDAASVCHSCCQCLLYSTVVLTMLMLHTSLPFRYPPVVCCVHCILHGVADADAIATS